MFRKMRRFKQELSDVECKEILANGIYGTLCVIGDENYPYAVPINYIYIENAIYIHSAKVGQRHRAENHPVPVRNDGCGNCTAEFLCRPSFWPVCFPQKENVPQTGPGPHPGDHRGFRQNLHLGNPLRRSVPPAAGRKAERGAGRIPGEQIPGRIGRSAGGHGGRRGCPGLDLGRTHRTAQRKAPAARRLCQEDFAEGSIGMNHISLQTSVAE